MKQVLMLMLAVTLSSPATAGAFTPVVMGAPVLVGRANESLIVSRRERCVWSVTRSVMGPAGRLVQVSARQVVTYGREMPMLPVQPLPKCPKPAAGVVTVRN